MTKEQLRELIGETVEEKLIELLGDPDEGLASGSHSACGSSASGAKWRVASEASLSTTSLGSSVCSSSGIPGSSSGTAARDLARLDKPEARRIVQRINWLASNLGTVKPEALSGDLTGFYKLRIGDFR